MLRLRAPRKSCAAEPVSTRCSRCTCTRIAARRRSRDPLLARKPTRCRSRILRAHPHERRASKALYGAVDKEALPVTARARCVRCCIGQDALAVERLWDQMYRSNRHSRASHYMMAHQLLSTTRCGTCAGAILGAPVYRLLGGPTQHARARSTAAASGSRSSRRWPRKRAAQLAKDGFVQQKWFLGLRSRRRRARDGPERAARARAARRRRATTSRSCSTPTRAGTCSTRSSGAARSSNIVRTSLEEAVPHGRRRELHPPDATPRRPDRHRRAPLQPLGGRAVPQGRTPCTTCRPIRSGAAASARP